MEKKKEKEVVKSKKVNKNKVTYRTSEQDEMIKFVIVILVVLLCVGGIYLFTLYYFFFFLFFHLNHLASIIPHLKGKSNKC